MILRLLCILVALRLATSAAETMEVKLVAPRLSSIRDEISKREVLSSLKQAHVLTAQIIWSRHAVDTPDDQLIQERSAVVKVGAEAKEKIVHMLSNDVRYEDYDAPCLCLFQPQLRLSWTTHDGQTAFAVLISGVSHGEIRTYRNGEEVCEIKEGMLFIPVYLDILDRIFPAHEMTVNLRKFHEEVRLKGKDDQSTEPAQFP